MRRNLLVLHPGWPRPDRCSGDYQLHQLIRLLRQTGHAVTVVGLYRLEPEERDRYRSALLEMGCDLGEIFPSPDFHRPWSQDHGLARLRAIVERNRFDAALVSFWNLAGEFVPFLRQVAPRLRIAVHSWDVWYLREMRGAALAGHLPLLARIARRRHEELAAYALADTALAVTDADAAVIAAGM